MTQASDGKFGQAAGRVVATLGHKSPAFKRPNSSLTRVADFAVNGLLPVKSVIPAPTSSSNFYGESTLQKPENDDVSTTERTSLSLWQRLAAAFQQIRLLEKKNSDTTEALIKSCARINEVCAAWNEQSVELQSAEDKLATLSLVFAGEKKRLTSEVSVANEKFENSEGRRLLLEKQIKDCQAAEAQTAHRLLSVGIELNNKAAEVAGLSARLDAATLQLEWDQQDNRKALDLQRNRFLSELLAKDEIIRQKEKEIGLLQSERRDLTALSNKQRREFSALGENNRRMRVKYISLVEHLDLIESRVVRARA